MGTAAQPKWGWATACSSFDWADQVETAKLVSGGQADLCGCFSLFMRLKCNTVPTAAKLKKGTGANRTVLLWQEPLGVDSFYLFTLFMVLILHKGKAPCTIFKSEKKQHNKHIFSD